MHISSRYLVGSIGASLILSLWALWSVVALEREFRRTVMTNMVTVPANVAVSRASAGLGMSGDGDDVALWLGRIDSNAQTRIASSANGEQMLGFYDRKGKLRLSIGISAAGEAHIWSVDATGARRVIDMRQLSIERPK